MVRFNWIRTSASIATPMITVVFFWAAPQAWAESIEAALAQAYANNSTLNFQRAGTRVTDENVPQALAGYRPKVAITASGGEQSISTTSKVSGSVPPAAYLTESGHNAPYGVGLTLTQTVFNGFQTASKTRQAEAQVLASRENLRLSEQTILLNAATAYMNLLRDIAVLDLQKRNIDALKEQLRQTRDRFVNGELTRTDVAQAEASLAAGRSQYLNAESSYVTSVATYAQVIGHEPTTLSAPSPVDSLSPSNLVSAIEVAKKVNPTVTMAQYNVDAALQQVKAAEGALAPTLTIQASYQQNYMNSTSLDTYQSYNASLIGQLSIPLYQGGGEYSLIRQTKEALGQQRIGLDVARDQARQSVIQAWGQLAASKTTIEATREQVKAAEIALNGIREEAQVGQRTTFDVLTALQNLVTARVALVNAQHDRIVASYSLLAAVGRLSAQTLGLRVSAYNAQVHYNQVRDSWAGMRTPDGR